jgi:hypothetical protein
VIWVHLIARHILFLAGTRADLGELQPLATATFVVKGCFIIFNSTQGKDEPQTLRDAIMLDCPMGADGGQICRRLAWRFLEARRMRCPQTNSQARSSVMR